MIKKIPKILIYTVIFILLYISFYEIIYFLFDKFYISDKCIVDQYWANCVSVGIKSMALSELAAIILSIISIILLHKIWFKKIWEKI